MKQGTLFELPPATAIAVEPVLATGFSFGDKVQYLMNYNGVKQWWDGFVIEDKPELRLMVKFLDNFKYEVTVRKEQMQYLRKAGC